MNLKKRYIIEVFLLLILLVYAYFMNGSYVLFGCLAALLFIAYLIESEIFDRAENKANRIATYLECGLLVATYITSQKQPDTVIVIATILSIVFKFLSESHLPKYLGTTIAIFIVLSSFHFVADRSDKINADNKFSSDNAGQIFQDGIGNPSPPKAIIEAEVIKSAVTPPFKITKSSPYSDIIIFTCLFSILVILIEMTFRSSSLLMKEKL